MPAEREENAKYFYFYYFTRGKLKIYWDVYGK